MIIKSIVVLFFIYLIYAGIFFFLQRKLIYPTSVIPASELLTENGQYEKYFIRSGESKVEVLFFSAKDNKGQGQPLLIIAHGNASLIDYWTDLLDKPLEMGLNILLVEYPGYGRSTGTPSQQSITDVFIKAYDQFAKDERVDKNRIVFFGRSLGGGVVCSLAKHREPAALILSSTFSSIRSFTSQYFLPGFLASDPYDNLALIEEYTGPLMLVHGTADKTIPIAHSRKLKSVHPHAFWLTYNTDHNNTPPNWDNFWGEVNSFLIQAGIFQNEV
jgi:pimeloyl-ACP methyl ester carboxylesterase